MLNTICGTFTDPIILSGCGIFIVSDIYREYMHPYNRRCNSATLVTCAKLAAFIGICTGICVTIFGALRRISNVASGDIRISCVQTSSVIILI